METRAPLKILFLCTGNSARSILGEFLLRDLGGGRFDTFSAGAAPTGQVHPLAVEVLAQDYGLETPEARSKSLTELEGVVFDLVFTVCDNARESCPLWPHGTRVVHWGFPDPAAAAGSLDLQRQAFRNVARELQRRLRLLCSRPLEDLEPEDLESWASSLSTPHRHQTTANLEQQS